LLNSDTFRAVDVAIEFTTPASAVDNIKSSLKQGVPVVAGTTGWNDRIREVEQYCSAMNGGLFYASNYSIGVNILFAMNQKLAALMKRFPQYTVSIEEIHHIHKLDAPSGTAISLAEQVIGEIEPLENWSLKKAADQGSPAESSTLLISAIREGEVKGKHAVHYDSELDTVTLAHSAKSRNAFAIGALMAAEFMAGKKGIYGMKDLLNL
jgi:4-hydroxy-tetrahydrodipicolinate reductase